MASRACGHQGLAHAHPDRVAAMQAHIEVLGKEVTRPLALMSLAKVGPGAGAAA
ncbi:MAG: hypothetical protein J0L84_01940 [Verrucomicrobia bacterium]|nr:hypothetical protein [Verrucomicrobiota bacterium]